MLSFWYQARHISSRLVRSLSAGIGVTIGFLAVMRLTYELFFPQLDWTGRIEIVVPLAILICVATTYYSPRTRLWWLPLPLLINLIWLFDPAVNLLSSRLIFSAALWLIALFWLDHRTSSFKPNRRRWLFTPLLVVPILAIYLLTMSHSVGFADTFEFQVTAPKLGIVHPTGYPLYLILGKLWTLIPFNSVAWRLNLGTAIYSILAAVLTFWLLTEIGREKDELTTLRPWVDPAALIASATLVTLPIVWSQAIAAEVYTLHLLLTSAALFLINRLLTQRIDWDRGAMLLALLLGFGMTNHVTTVFLLPAAALAIWWSWPKGALLRSAETYWGRGLQLAGIFLAPLSLYAYLPIRWRAVNNEPMGITNFFDWIFGRRFGGSLILRAVLDDSQRFQIFGQLILDQWPLWLLALAATGALILCAQHWRLGIVLLLTTAGFTFYTLSYYVADLAVFMLPIHLAIAIFCGFGLMSLVEGLNLLFQSEKLPAGSFRLEALSGLPFLLLVPLAIVTSERYPTLNLSADDGRETWARAVLSQDLAPNSAILADSEKHPPLYYVQQTENLRTDLDIMILPEEAAYRAELDQRIAAGETVYLARFLPQLAGVYNLQAAGPLTEVTAAQINPSLKPAKVQFGQIDLIDSNLSKGSPFDQTMVKIDLTWRVNETPNDQLKVFLRWQGFDSVYPAGRLPVNDFLPFNGVQPSQTIVDFYQIPLLIEHLTLEEVTLEIALAPPFTPAEKMDWKEVGKITLLSGAHISIDLESTDFRIMAVDRFNNPRGLSGKGLKNVYLPEQMRPGQLPALLTSTSYMYQIKTEPPISGDLTAGNYAIFANIRQVPSGSGKLALRCGWLQLSKERCYLGEINVSGASLPNDAINYADKIGLLDSAVNGQVSPNGQITVETVWQGLQKIDEDYTIFLQVLSDSDQIVGQLDVKPAQGTRPTTLWEPGETLADKYVIPLNDEVSADQSYRLIIGFYRLSDFQRLTVIDQNGSPIADHFAIPLESPE
ncbi:MAG: DUF2723 domain-containing protein [Anaerolineae bacterium]